MRAMPCEAELRATRAVLPNPRKTIWVPRSSFAIIRAKPPDAMTGIRSLWAAAGIRTRPGASS